MVVDFPIKKMVIFITILMKLLIITVIQMKTNLYLYFIIKIINEIYSLFFN